MDKIVSCSIGFSLVVMLLIMAMVVLREIKQPRRQKEILKCTFNLSDIRGVIFGKKGRNYVYSPSEAEGHVFVGGGSGTGKTSAVLIPTLRAWGGTSLTVDISGDISKRVACQNKMVYAPLAAESVPYDVFAPIDALSEDEDRIEALEQLAWNIMPELQNSSANADYFQNGGRSILTAALIWGYHQGLDFVQICEKIVESSYSKLLNEIDKSHDKAATRYINQFEGNSPQNTAGCKQNADRAVTLFATNANVKRTVRRPDRGETAFSCGSVEDYNVFVRIPDEKLETLAPLLRIITAQTLNYLAGRDEEKTTPILLALDEFVSLGKLEIAPALRKLRKKYVRIIVLTQSMADIDELYGKESRMAMMNNFAFKVILSAGDTDSQKYYAELIGQEEKVKVSTTSGSIWNGRNATETKSTERYYIIEPADLDRLDDELILLYPGGHMRLKKNFYYEQATVLK